jgi:hypothetical protein
MELDRPAGGRSVSVSYLARGVAWVPAYLIDLSDEKTATFSARALIINELADFNDAEIELITGFPNIRFGEVNSPVAMNQNLSEFMNALARGRTETYRGGGQMLAQQAVMMSEPVSDRFGTPPAPAYSTAAKGLVSEDLFLYPVKHVTLRRGETLWIPLFTSEMPYKHVYTWTIDNLLDKNDRYSGRRDRAGGKPAEEVWHSCRLVNTLDMPLTTAATEFVKDGKFTGQDVCYYTAPGAKTTIRMNRAMNILAEQNEIEMERSRNAARFQGYAYDLVRIRGELTLRSRLKRSVHVEVTKALSGEVLDTSPHAENVKTAKGLKKVNPKHVLTWTLKLKAGEKRTLTYGYQVYIRS